MAAMNGPWTGSTCHIHAPGPDTMTFIHHILASVTTRSPVVMGL